LASTGSFHLVKDALDCRELEGSIRSEESLDEPRGRPIHAANFLAGKFTPDRRALNLVDSSTAESKLQFRRNYLVPEWNSSFLSDFDWGSAR
jgi:hypothetical protein